VGAALTVAENASEIEDARLAGASSFFAANSGEV
jgi:hypothetical protein